MYEDALIIDQNDIGVINAIASLYITYGNSFFAKDILELSYELDATNNQTIRLLCIANIKCGAPDIAHQILENHKQTYSLSFTQTFLHKLSMFKAGYIDKPMTNKIKAL